MSSRTIHAGRGKSQFAYVFVEAFDETQSVGLEQ